MKQFYILLIITSTLTSSDLLAQVVDNYKFLDINNMKIPLFSRGDMFRPGFNNSHTAQMPQGEITKTLHTNDMWFGGIDQNNELRMASQIFSVNDLGNVEYALGPASNSNVQEFESQYNHVWKINKTEIEEHIANYNNPTYTIPEDILNWPAHGDIQHGEANNLAPFVDVNSNGIYEPTLGDYPKIRGDQTLFAMFNDLKYDATNSSGQKVYVETHVTLYGYNNPYVDFLENSFFVHYDIFNRSENLTYNDFYVAHFLNFDLGFYGDDYIGTHVTKNIAYAYNGDADDEGFFGYGEKPPAFGWALLNKDYVATRSISYSTNQKLGYPLTPLTKLHTMQGLFNDGTPYYHGNNIWNGDETTTFFFPGSSHPTISEHWDEITAGYTPSDRHMTASTVSHNFGPGDKICLDYAGVFSRDYTSDTQHQLNHLFADVDGVQSIYNYENFECSTYPLSIPTPEGEILDIFATNSALSITKQNGYNKPIQAYIINALGQKVHNFELQPNQFNKTIDISQLTPGVYFVPNHAFKFIKH